MIGSFSANVFTSCWPDFCECSKLSTLSSVRVGPSPGAYLLTSLPKKDMSFSGHYLETHKVKFETLNGNI